MTNALWKRELELVVTSVERSTREAEFDLELEGTDAGAGDVALRCERRAGVPLPPAAGGAAQQLWLLLRPHERGEAEAEARARAEETAALLACGAFTVESAALAIDWWFEGRTEVDQGNAARLVLGGTFDVQQVRTWLPTSEVPPAVRALLAERAPLPEPSPRDVAECDALVRSFDLSRLFPNSVAGGAEVFASAIVWCDRDLVPLRDAAALRRCCGARSGPAPLRERLAALEDARIVVAVDGLPGAFVLQPERAWLLAATARGASAGSSFRHEALLHARVAHERPPIVPYASGSAVRPGGSLRIRCALTRRFRDLDFGALAELAGRVLLTPATVVGDLLVESAVSGELLRAAALAFPRSR